MRSVEFGERLRVRGSYGVEGLRSLVGTVGVSIL